MSGSLQADQTARDPSQRRGVAPTVALAVMAVVVVVIESLERTLRPRNHDGGLADLTWLNIALNLGEHALLVMAAWIPVRLLAGRVRASDFGLCRVPWRSALASAAVPYGAYLVLVALLFAIAGAPSERDSAGALARVDSTVLLIGYAITLCVVSPVIEELLFRGFLFSALRRRLGAAPAVIAAGALFGAVHGPPLGTMLDLALLGVALCAIYERTGSLLPCIAVHAVHNCVVFGDIAALSTPATIAVTLAASAATLAVVMPLASPISPRPGARLMISAARSRG